MDFAVSTSQFPPPLLSHETEVSMTCNPLFCADLQAQPQADGLFTITAIPFVPHVFTSWRKTLQKRGICREFGKITPVQQAVYNISTITTPPMSQVLTPSFHHHTSVLSISSFVLFNSCDGLVFPGREPPTAMYPAHPCLCTSRIIRRFRLLFRPGKGAFW